METGVSRGIIDYHGPLYERLTGHPSTAGSVPGDTEFEDLDFNSLRFRYIAVGGAAASVVNGGPDPAGFAPDAILLNQNGKSFSPRLLDCLPPKSLLAVTDNSPGGTPLMFVTKGGLVPGEMEEGYLYAIDRK